MITIIVILSALLAASVVALSWSLVGRHDARNSVRMLTAAMGSPTTSLVGKDATRAERTAEGQAVAPCSIIVVTVARMLPGETFYAEESALAVDRKRAAWLKGNHVVHSGPQYFGDASRFPLEIARDDDGHFVVKIRSRYPKWDLTPLVTSGMIPVAELLAPPGGAP